MAGTIYTIEDTGRDREAWLSARKNGIGASEVGVVMGVSPWGSRMALYADKRGTQLPDFDNPVTDFGLEFEPILLAHYAAARGRRVRSDGRLLRSKRYPWLTCTMDARQWKLDGTFIGGVEAKTTIDDWGRDGLPMHVDLQVQTQYLVTGWPVIDIAIFHRWSATHGHMVVPPHKETQEKILHYTHEFWTQHVKAGVPPSVDPSDSCRLALQALYPQHEVGKIIELDEHAARLVASLDVYEAELKLQTGNVNTVKNELRAMIQDAEYVKLPDGSGFANRLETREAFVMSASETRVLRRLKNVDATIERRHKEALRLERKQAKEREAAAAARASATLQESSSQLSLIAGGRG